MENWLVALIATAGAVGGSTVTGMVAYHVARLEREARNRDELRAALAAYGAALDRLTLRVEQLPQAHGIEEGEIAKLVARWRTLDWLLGRLSVATAGRGAERAVDEVISARNRLALVAPEAVLESMQAMDELIRRFDPGAAGWKEEWQEARVAFARVASKAVRT